MYCILCCKIVWFCWGTKNPTQNPKQNESTHKQRFYSVMLVRMVFGCSLTVTPKFQNYKKRDFSFLLNIWRQKAMCTPICYVRERAGLSIQTALQNAHTQTLTHTRAHTKAAWPFWINLPIGAFCVLRDRYLWIRDASQPAMSFHFLTAPCQLFSCPYVSNHLTD